MFISEGRKKNFSRKNDRYYKEHFHIPPGIIEGTCRGIEWSLRAFASMRAVPLFLRARAVINFLMRAASTLKITNGEQRARRKFSASWNLSLLKSCFAPRNLADTSKQDLATWD